MNFNSLIAVVQVLEFLSVEVNQDTRREIRTLLCNEEVLRKAENCKTTPEFWLSLSLYPSLIKAAHHIFALPNSNAETGRLFSMMKAVHTPVRNSLLLTTINNILSIKVNKVSPYTVFDFDETVKQKCKKATAEYNELHRNTTT